MAKRLTILVAMLALMLVAAVPAFAQQQDGAGQEAETTAAVSGDTNNGTDAPAVSGDTNNGTDAPAVSGDTNNGDGGSGGSGRASGPPPTPSGKGLLPATGGLAPFAAAIGVALIAGGLVARRVMR